MRLLSIVLKEMINCFLSKYLFKIFRENFFEAFLITEKTYLNYLISFFQIKLFDQIFFVNVRQFSTCIPHRFFRGISDQTPKRAKVTNAKHGKVNSKWRKN